MVNSIKYTMKNSISPINKAISELKDDGFAIINNYLSDTIELANFKHKFYTTKYVNISSFN